MVWSREERKEYYRLYYQRNRKKLIERTRNWQKKNKEKVDAYRKEYEQRPEVRRRNYFRIKKYNEENRSSRNEDMRRYRKRKKDADPDYLKKEYLKDKERIKKNPKRLERRRKRYKTYYYKNLKKIRARSAARAVNIDEKSCVNCGEKKNLQKHHPDYNKPKEIVVLCIDCHKKEHLD